MRQLFLAMLTVVALLGATVGVKAAINALPSDITGTGMNQDALVVFLGNVVSAVNEMVDDHATNRISILEMETLIEELAADHATFKTALDATETLIEEMHDDHATNKTFTDELKTDVNALKTDVGTIATKLDNDATVTDTNYAAQISGTSVASSGAATLTAEKPASGPATLSAATAITAPAAALSNSTDLTLSAP